MKKKKRAVISDSDSDGETAAPVVKKPAKLQEKVGGKAEVPKPKLKEINATDFFATNSTKSELTPSKKRKEADDKLSGEKSAVESSEAKKQRTASPETKPSLSAKLAGKVGLHIQSSLVSNL